MFKDKKKIIKFLIKSVVSLGFVAWLVASTNWSDVFQLIGKVNPRYVFLYVVLLVLGILVSSYKWKSLSVYKGVSAPLAVFFKYYLAGIFVNNFMPSFIGGDAFKAYSLGRPEGKYKESSSAVIVDRITGLVGALMLALVFATLNRSVFASSEILTAVYFSILSAFLAFVFYLFARKMRLWGMIKEKFPPKVGEYLSILNSYADAKILSLSLVYSVFFSLVGIALANYVLFMSFGVRMGVVDYLSVIFLISIVSSIPVSINNIGIKEWAYVTFFGIFGIPGATVVAVAILSRFIQMIVSFFALPVYLKGRK
ncbi:MAG TPA: hypothetical protein DCX32_01695 [Candidatus Moranbacteria bacterium]|nr:MAG: Lysylphosphatidylglycerol synthetase/UPF0104 [Parcubacteria group bacterium GW2011_GWC1_45_14]HAV11235.1 hypothetical protein [Candidatus Moranbacteria bacterium]